MATPTPPSSSSNRWSHVTPSPSPSSSSVPQNRNNNNSMEQVWKDIIKLAPLSDGSPSSSATTNNTRSSSRNVLLHDFITTKHSSAVLLSCNPISSSAAQPITLSLYKHPNNSLLSSFDIISKSSTDTSPSNGKQRVQQDVCACGPSDPRHQRMIRNRESAVRSRARKQAYKNALELKLARLTEENSRLRQQVEEMKLRMTAAAKNPKMRALYRTSTCPF